MIASLDGWQLAAVILAAIMVGGFLLVLIIIREGRSRKVRVGVFVERETLPGPYDVDEDTGEWPVQK